MEIFRTKSELSEFLTSQKAENKKIGFVPTMGALHNGHLSLVSYAQLHADLVVVSIFVNPTQFNDPADLENYPRPVEADIKKLRDIDCDVLFLPPVNEMYGQNEMWHIELGNLENILEGASRPGHYQGVTQIVNKLFQAVKPHISFFGQKDFQQVMILRKMAEIMSSPVKIVMCPIIREHDGLALSSRNIHLSDAERSTALALSRVLTLIKEQFKNLPLPELQRSAEEMLRTTEGVVLDYFEIRRASDLEPATDKNLPLIALVAAQVGKTRLIDNMLLNP